MVGSLHSAVNCGYSLCALLLPVLFVCVSGRIPISRRSLALPTAPGMSLSLPAQCGPAHMLGTSA